MKHLFTLIAAVLFAGNISAQTTVGAADNTTGWWTAFSEYYTIAPNKTLKLKFANYSSKVNNWSNWLTVVTTDADRNADGYSEYCVLRADNYAWQYGLNTGPDSSHDWFTSLTSNYNWDTFKDDMDGSTVVMTIERKKAVVTIHADITPAAGGSYFEEFVINCGDGTQNIRTFLTTENGHLVIDDEATAFTDTELPEEPSVEGQLVGLQDNTTAWWTAFSDYYQVPSGKTLTIEFTNFTDKIENFHNWLCIASTDAPRGGDNYSEYFVLRADNYAWGDGKNTWNDPSNEFFWGTENFILESNYNWDTFKNDMDGANVVLEVTNDAANNQILTKASITPAGSTTEPYVMTFVKKQANFTPVVTETISVFLSIEGGHLIIKDSKLTDYIATAIKSVETATSKNAVRYNLAGQKVGAGYKGVVIENGKKVFIK
jgi:hypothetical protein